MSPTIIFHIVDVFSALCGRIELIPLPGLQIYKLKLPTTYYSDSFENQLFYPSPCLIKIGENPQSLQAKLISSPSLVRTTPKDCPSSVCTMQKDSPSPECTTQRDSPSS